MLNIIYEDNHLLVVIKPHNVLSQGDETQDEDMLSLCKKYIKEKYNKQGNVYVGLVHRLDRPTGGVMVFAKTSKAAARLSAMIGTDDFEKTYLAVCYNKPRIEQNYLVNYLKKDAKNNIVTVVPQLTEGAKKAQLKYSLIDFKDNLSLLKVWLYSGRSHQIRVQLATMGNAVYGDVKYAHLDCTKSNGLALWAYKLSFKHPVEDKIMNFTVFPDETQKPWNLFSFDKI